MCGRGACTLSGDRCRRVAGSGAARKIRGAEKLRKRYNLGPQGYVPVVRHVASCGDTGDCKESTNKVGAVAGVREVCIMRWGLIPAFAKRMEDYDVFKGGSSTFNARVESAESSGLWRRLLDRKRGVVLFDGFFEWKTSGKSKTPMFIRHRDKYDGHTIDPATKAETDPESDIKLDVEGGPRHAPLLLAALYDVWNAGEASQEGIDSVSILTMEPDGTPMFEVHDRMPIFLTPETAALWLDPSAKWKDIIGTVVKASQVHAQSQLLIYEVSPLVSNIRNESPDCILSKKDFDARQLSKGIGRFFQKKNVTSGGDTGASDVSQLRMGSEQTPQSAKRKASPEPEISAKVSKVIELD